ncbi:MAG: ThiF family adenylyltransferase [bacterium]|nr:ThiF family adenylyltransferase [bacterium]
MLDDLSNRLQPTKSTAVVAPKPVFFDLKQEADQQKIKDLLDQKPHTKIIDTYATQLKELFVLNNPALHVNPPERDKQFEQHAKEHYGQQEPWQAGKWVYLSWRHILLHILDDDGYQQVRTGRNRNIIPADEQTKYYHSTIGIAGLSVGNSVALSIVLTGGGKHLKLADPDTLELTNLNRIRGSISELTEPKTYMAARQIYELDPYADITFYPDGLTEDNINDFFDGLDVVIDEIDQLGMKIRIRQEAKKRKIPVVMAADNGDSGILDIERHDLDDNIPYFHGRAGEDIAEQVLDKNLPLPLIGQMIGEKLIGYDVTEPRLQESLLEIGKTIPTWPQLGGAALLNGVIVSAAVRKILTGQPLIDNRAVASVSSWLIPDYDSPADVKKRAKDTKEFTKQYNANIEAFLKMIGWGNASSPS